jgi:hypothetical protein
MASENRVVGFEDPGAAQPSPHFRTALPRSCRSSARPGRRAALRAARAGGAPITIFFFTYARSSYRPSVRTTTTNLSVWDIDDAETGVALPSTSTRRRRGRLPEVTASSLPG